MDGSRSPADLVAAAAARGWSAFALADQNNLYALPELVDASLETGMKPIAAAALETGGAALRAYCLDRRGYARLCELLTRILAVEVPRRRMRLPPEVLAAEARDLPSAEELFFGRELDWSEDKPARQGFAGRGRFAAEAAGGAAVGTGSAARGSAARKSAPPASYDLIADLRSAGWEGLALASEDPRMLATLAGRLAGGLAGRGRLYAALPLGFPQEGTVRAARELGLPLLAEHFARFTEAGDAELWRLARAVEERRTLASIERLGEAEEPPGAALLPSSRAHALLSAFPEALESAAALAEEAAPAASFFSDVPVFPAYRGLDDEESFFLLRSLCAEGARRRYGPRSLEGPSRESSLRGPHRALLRERLERELCIIRDKGFSAYFLVVRDIVSRCPRTCGRGSAASSLVSYLLGLTHVDPLEHDLFFERFLNEGRKDPPDIDIDFPWDERPAVLASVLAEYEGRAAMVAEHCRFSRRGSLRESALALGMGEEDIRGAARALRLGTAGELQPELLRLSRLVEGMPRYIGTHPGGIVITPQPISRYCHVQDSPAGLPVLAWEKEGAERAGLVKIDLLGNRSLAVLRDCIELVNAEVAIAPSAAEAAETPSAAEGPKAPLSWDFPGADADPASRALVESGRSMGVFYIESPATRQLLLKMGEVDYRRLVAASSIIRPAANKWINEYVRRLRGGSWKRLPEAVEETLAETFGIMVYQEDVSRVAMAAARFDAVAADGLRKVLTKKRRGGALEDFKDRFMSGCAASLVGEEDRATLWDMMLSFDGYSFCKAHSASYALVSYRLAWMKAHYPSIFMASVINNGGGFYDTQAYVGEARRLGIEVLPPHVNSSWPEYRVEAHSDREASRVALRVGLSQLQGLSRATLERIVAAREALRSQGAGGFSSLSEFAQLAAPKQSELRALVRSGCLDALPARSGGPPLGRPQALWALHRLRERSRRAAGRGSEPALGPALGLELIEDSWEPPEWIRDYAASMRLADEARLLGLVLACVPASLFEGRAALVARRRGLPPPSPSSRLAGGEGRRLCLAGTAVAGKEVVAKDGRSMAFYTFEDAAGLFETVFFPQAYAKALPTLEGNRAVLMVGTARREFGALSLHVEEAFGLNRPA